jgi:hypothetical protein
MILRNCWYAAAWSHELNHNSPIARNPPLSNQRTEDSFRLAVQRTEDSFRLAVIDPLSGPSATTGELGLKSW